LNNLDNSGKHEQVTFGVGYTNKKNTINVIVEKYENPLPDAKLQSSFQGTLSSLAAANP